MRYRIYESLVGMIQHFITDKWQGEIITQVQITACKLQVDEQLDLFAQEHQQSDLQRTLRAINNKYNKNIVTYARIIEPIK